MSNRYSGGTNLDSIFEPRDGRGSAQSTGHFVGSQDLGDRYLSKSEGAGATAGATGIYVGGSDLNQYFTVLGDVIVSADFEATSAHPIITAYKKVVWGSDWYNGEDGSLISMESYHPFSTTDQNGIFFGQYYSGVAEDRVFRTTTVCDGINPPSPVSQGINSQTSERDQQYHAASNIWAHNGEGYIARFREYTINTFECSFINGRYECVPVNKDGWVCDLFRITSNALYGKKTKANGFDFPGIRYHDTYPRVLSHPSLNYFIVFYHKAGDSARRYTVRKVEKTAEMKSAGTFSDVLFPSGTNVNSIRMLSDSISLESGDLIAYFYDRTNKRIIRVNITHGSTSVVNYVKIEDYQGNTITLENGGTGSLIGTSLTGYGFTSVAANIHGQTKTTNFGGRLSVKEVIPAGGGIFYIRPTSTELSIYSNVNNIEV